jgi:hypothetical protein
MTRLRKYLPHLLLWVAAMFLLSVILDVYRGKPFVLDLILGAVSALCAVSSLSKRRAGGVITSFHELHITRTELIKGDGTDAPRVPLRGLSAKVENTGTKTEHNDERRVHLTIKGPDTEFVYPVDANSRSANLQALRFAATLNQLARRQLR